MNNGSGSCPRCHHKNKGKRSLLYHSCGPAFQAGELTITRVFFFLLTELMVTGFFCSFR